MYNVEIVTNIEYPLIGPVAHTFENAVIKLNFHVCLHANVVTVMTVLGIET